MVWASFRSVFYVMWHIFVVRLLDSGFSEYYISTIEMKPMMAKAPNVMAAFRVTLGHLGSFWDAHVQNDFNQRLNHKIHPKSTTGQPQIIKSLVLLRKRHWCLHSFHPRPERTPPEIAHSQQRNSGIKKTHMETHEIDETAIIPALDFKWCRAFVSISRPTKTQEDCISNLSGI